MGQARIGEMMPIFFEFLLTVLVPLCLSVLLVLITTLAGWSIVKQIRKYL